MASIFDSLKKTFNKPNVSRFVNNAARTYFTKIDPVGRAVNQGVQLARFAQAKRPDQFIKNEVVKPITKRIAQSGVAIGDIVERSNPAINAYHGLKPFVQNIGQPNYMNKVAQGQLQGIGRPLNYERIYNKNVMNPADAREFIGRAVEAPTYLYSGTKGLGSLQGKHVFHGDRREALCGQADELPGRAACLQKLLEKLQGPAVANGRARNCAPPRTIGSSARTHARQVLHAG